MEQIIAIVTTRIASCFYLLDKTEFCVFCRNFTTACQCTTEWKIVSGVTPLFHVAIIYKAAN